MRRQIHARRSDFLCGRVTSLIHARAMAAHLDGDLHFSWPDSRLYGNVCTPEQLFSEIFLEQHLKDNESEIVRALERYHVFEKPGDAFNRDAAEILVRCINDAHVENTVGVGVVPYVSHLPVNVFSDLIRELFEKGRGQARFDAVHVRHGDLVSGDWRHFGHIQRFVPFDAIAHTARSRSEALPELYVFSENPTAAEQLLPDLPSARPANALPFAQGFPDMRPDLLDLFSMVHARTVFGPRASAFSGFAAKYYGRNRVIIDDRFTLGWAEEKLKLPYEVGLDAQYEAKRASYMAEIFLLDRPLAPAPYEDLRRALDFSMARDPENAFPHLLSGIISALHGQSADAGASFARFVEMTNFLTEIGWNTTKVALRRAHDALCKADDSAEARARFDALHLQAESLRAAAAPKPDQV